MSHHTTPLHIEVIAAIVFVILLGGFIALLLAQL